MFYKKSLYRVNIFKIIINKKKTKKQKQTNHINYKIEDNPNRVLNSSKYKQLVHIIPQL